MSLQLGNASQQHQASFLAYGFIMLPKKYELHYDIVVICVTVMCFVSVIANTILLFVIIKDHLKQFRTITDILLAFNSAANICTSVCLLLERLPTWSHDHRQLIMYLNACVSNLYFIGNILHLLNIYGTIVTPIRYKLLKSKARKPLIPILCILWILIHCAFIIPPYTLPERQILSYLKVIPTVTCVLFAVLSVTFIFCYYMIFQVLHARKQLLSSMFNIKPSTSQGPKILKQNCELAKTLFIHVLFFVMTSAPGSIIVMMFLHCTSCDITTVQLGALYAIPAIYTSFVFLPFLWLFRFNNYRRALRKFVCF